jgi:1-acyl-sn-glycerol-3-phosphate acyltransferase
LTKLRGYLAVVFLFLAFVILDPIQRVVIASWARLVPSRRIRIYSRWQRFLAHLVLQFASVLGGARIPQLPAIQGREGVLVLMNHQSVLDVPLVVASVHGTYLNIITRKRYQRWIPLISHLVRLYQYPVVDPRANSEETKRMLASIRDAARSSDVPLAIFPEGTRTKDGEIGPFRPTGLKLVLKQRPWTVYILVADGFWVRARMKHLLDGMADIRGKITLVGPFEWEDPRGDTQAFSEAMRQHMVGALSSLRKQSPA